MKCPKCHQRVAPFKSWVLWPGPTRDCVNCHAHLRYVGFHLQAILHLVIGIPVFGALGLMTASHTLAIWQAVLISLGILAITAVVLPWNFARYEECNQRGDGKKVSYSALLHWSLSSPFFIHGQTGGAQES